MSCAIAKYDICLRANRGWGMTAVFKKDDVVMDLTGVEFYMQVRSRSSNAAVLLDISPYITKIDSAGEITIELPYSITSELTFSAGRYDLMLKLPDGDVLTPFGGDFKVEKGVTYA